MHQPPCKIGQRHRIGLAQEATLVLNNPTSSPVDRYASFYLASAAPRVVTVEGAGVYQNWRIDPSQPAQARNLRFTLAPGENRILFSTTTPPTPQAIGLITFDVVNFDLSERPMPE